MAIFSGSRFRIAVGMALEAEGAAELCLWSPEEPRVFWIGFFLHELPPPDKASVLILGGLSSTDYLGILFVLLIIKLWG